MANNDLSCRPHLLADNRVPVYYAGGGKINEFRRLSEAVSGPEDWVGSLVPLPAAILGADADPTTGISRLDGGALLSELVAEDPEGWLGADLVDAFGTSSALLVKLLDAGERLPVHCHPSRSFAQRHLGSLFGKTEGWIVMRADPGACIWIGFAHPVDRSDLRAWIDQQDVESMLKAMMQIPVKAGEVIYVPAGTPHAIGPGVMITELQEPTSFSVLADYEAFGVEDTAATLGLGWDLALSCFDLSGYHGRMDLLLHQPSVISASSSGRIERLFDRQADEYFRALRVRCNGEVNLAESTFAILVLTEGSGELQWGQGRIQVHAGMTLVVPHAAGPLTFRGSLEALACLPPVAHVGADDRPMSQEVR